MWFNRKSTVTPIALNAALFIVILWFCVQTRILRPRPLLCFPPSLTKAERSDWTLIGLKGSQKIVQKVNEETCSPDSVLILGYPENPGYYIMSIGQPPPSTVLVSMGLLETKGDTLCVGLVAMKDKSIVSTRLYDIFPEGNKSMLAAFAPKTGENSIILGDGERNLMQARLVMFIYDASRLVPYCKRRFYWFIHTPRDLKNRISYKAPLKAVDSSEEKKCRDYSL